MSRVAAMDLGTNTVRLAVVEYDGERARPLFSGQVITRLGQNLHKDGKLSDMAMRRTTEGIASLLHDAEQFAPFRISIVITSAGREASNTQTLNEMVHAATGHEIRVISGEEEARLSLRGARLVTGDGVDDFVLLDIGGGSTEYVLSRNGALAGAHSTDLGVVRLAETYLSKHPVIEQEYNRMCGEIGRSVAKAFGIIGARGDETLVGTAGTVTSLAAIDLNMVEYSPARINNHKLRAEAVERMHARLSKMTLEERGSIPSLDKGREDLIIPGIAIVRESLKRSGNDFLIVSDYGLREGMIMEMVEDETSR